MRVCGEIDVASVDYPGHCGDGGLLRLSFEDEAFGRADDVRVFERSILLLRSADQALGAEGYVQLERIDREKRRSLMRHTALGESIGWVACIDERRKLTVCTARDHLL